MVGWIDTHCHIDDEVFDQDRVQVLERCLGKGMKAILVPAIHRRQWQQQADIVESCSLLYGAYGLHPCYIHQHQMADVDALASMLAETGAVAVGEIGLDHFIEEAAPDRQLALFKAQLAVARDLRLPVILHARKSHDLMLKVLRQSPGVCGIVHAFSGSLQQAQQFADLGFLIGFGGGVTYDRANKLRMILRSLPRDAIALETDAPDIPPSFARDVPNSPEHLFGIGEIVARLLDVDSDEIAALTGNNAVRIFNLAV